MLQWILLTISVVIALVASIPLSRALQPNWRGKAPFMVGALALLLVIAGAELLLTETAHLQRQMQHKQWPVVQGVVLQADITEDRARQPIIIYRYEVAGQAYEQTTNLQTPAFGGRNSRLSTAEAIISFYSTGKPVTVHYNPADPADSALRVGPTWDIFAKLSFGTTLLVLGLATLIAGILARRRRSPNS